MAGNDFLFAGKKVPAKGPCFECPNREVGCHSVCEIYVDWNKQREEVRNRIYEEKSKRLEHVTYIRDTITRYSKRK